MQLLHGLSSGQVLQRLGHRGVCGATARLVGTVSGTGSILASVLARQGPLPGWKGRRVGQAKKGVFRAILKGLPEGGPYRLELRTEDGAETIRISPFFVGDVWLLAGQSNMEGCGNRHGGAKPHPLIQAFSLRRVWRRATEPLHIKDESPDSCHSSTQCTREEGEKQRRVAVKGTGPALHFARFMLQRSGVPQGLICAAHGGTSMTQWDPSLNRKKKNSGDSLYGSLLLSIWATDQPVAGVLWYQGESDATDADAPLYGKRIRRFIRSIRRDLRQPHLPFLVVQIARVFECGRNAGAWNRIQEEQRRLSGEVTWLETVAAVDLPLDDHIHIGADGHLRLGSRLARVANFLVYRNRGESRVPQLKAIGTPRQELSTNSIVLDVTFDNIVGGLHSVGETNGFALLDNQGKKLDIIYRVRLLGSSVRLYIQAMPPSGSRLSYGHGLTPVCNITDGRDFSLPAFGPLEI